MTDRPLSKLTLDDVVRVPRPGLGVPTRWRFTPDGAALTYLHSERADLVQSLWERRIEGDEVRLLAGPSAAAADEASLSLEEALRRERLRMRALGVTDYHFARRAEPPVLAVPSPEGVRVGVGPGELKLLAGTKGAQFARLSPDGKSLAFVREGELHVASPITGVVTRLTEGAEQGLTHGLAEFIAQEELERSDGFWWSGDSDYIAFEEADSRHIPTFTILHDDGRQQTSETHQYPFAGAENARVRIGVVRPSAGDTKWLDPSVGGDGYLADVCWRPDGALVVSWLDRGQTTLTIRSFEPPDWEGALLFEETIEPWLNLAHDIRFLSDGSFVRTSEHTGFRHIYLHDREGGITKALTGGDWAVTSLIALDSERRRVFFQATKDSVLERHIYAVGLDGGEIRRLTQEPGWHTATFDRQCRRFVDSFSSRAVAPITVLRSADDGQVERVLFEQEDAGAESLG
ncbi:MAG: DPP IV N-terminal domain-containing protein, partial [Dehalococcoidia bacterium]